MKKMLIVEKYHQLIKRKLPEGIGSGKKSSNWKTGNGVRGSLQILQLGSLHFLI